MRSTSFPSCISPAPKLTAVEVFPTPPLWFAIAITLVIWFPPYLTKPHQTARGYKHIVCFNSPHSDAGPPNAVKGSRRKYHYLSMLSSRHREPPDIVAPADESLLNLIAAFHIENVFDSAIQLAMYMRLFIGLHI